MILTVALLSFIVFWLSAQNVVQLNRGSFQIEYNPALGIPTRVSWAVRPSDIGDTKREPSYRFKADAGTPRPRITSALYTGTGYHRGHMCPAGDRSRSKSAMKQTFVMSNVCPMTPTLNTGAWKRTENLERLLALSHGRCSVIAAPIFFPCDTTWIGDGRIAVPHAFFKIMFNSSPSRVYGLYVLPNE